MVPAVLGGQTVLGNWFHSVWEWSVDSANQPQFITITSVYINLYTFVKYQIEPYEVADIQLFFLNLQNWNFM